MTWPTATLDELCEINIGRTPARANPDYWGDGQPWLSIADMTQGREITRTKEQITEVGAVGGRRVTPGTVLLSFKLSIGKVAKTAIPLFTNEAIAALPIRREDLVTEDFLMRALERADFSGDSNRAAMGATLNKAKLKEVKIPIPPLREQRRIVAILDHADALRAKRRQVLVHLDALAQAIFHDMFGGPTDAVAPLSHLAQVTSGLTKGRRTTEGTRPVPYLAVSNVQAGHLNLDVVKSIDATDREIDRYALADGDLVLTEGGDPDKLGRGTVWRSELPLCLHQNHIFRVRLAADSKVQSDYLSAFMAGRAARGYFLRAAKQTTGIASINMTQLKALPVATPSWADQTSFVARIEALNDERAVVQRAVAADDELFASLQSRAFRGEL